MGRALKDRTGQVVGTRTAVSCAGRDKRGQATWNTECSACHRKAVVQGGDLGTGYGCPCQSTNTLKDLTGQVFGTRTVVSRAGREKGGQATWNTECSACPRKAVVQGSSLGAGKGCPCQSAYAFKDLTGQVVGTRTVVSCAGRDKRGGATWNTECSACHSKAVVPGNNLGKGYGCPCQNVRAIEGRGVTRSLASWIRCLGFGVVDRLARGQTIDEIDNDLTFKIRPPGKESV